MSPALLLQQVYSQLEADPNCQADRKKHGSSRFVFGRGQATSRLVLVGEAPGANEARQGQPFVGAAGRLLNQALVAAGLADQPIYLTNVLKFRPQNNQTPSSSEIEHSRPYLLAELEALKPLAVGCLGKIASSCFWSKPALKEIAGQSKIVNLKRRQTTVVACYHPAAGIYQPKLKESLVANLKVLVNIFKNGQKR